MKIASANADRFVAKPDSKTRAIVIYGPDDGLVGERGKAAAHSVTADLHDAFRVVELSGAQVKADPARLADEMASMSLMGGRRVIRVRPAGDESAEALENALAAAGDALIVVEAGELTPKSKLRKLAESHPEIAAVACYADNIDALKQLIHATLAEFKLRATPDAASWLADNLGSDRGVSRRELEKLALYVGGRTEASLDDCMKIVGDSAALGMNDVALATGDGDLRALDRALDRVFAEGDAPVTVLRAVARHFQNLHAMNAAMQRGAQASAAVERARPPVHFSAKPRVIRQLGLWSPDYLGRALMVLTEAELQCKTTGMPDQAICRRACLSLANSANKAARNSAARRRGAS